MTPLKQAKAHRFQRSPRPDMHEVNITILSPAGKWSASSSPSVKVEVTTNDKKPGQQETDESECTPFSENSATAQEKNYCHDCRKRLPSQANLFEHNFAAHSQQSIVGAEQLMK
jgi:hypothetical protein